MKTFGMSARICFWKCGGVHFLHNTGTMASTAVEPLLGTLCEFFCHRACPESSGCPDASDLESSGEEEGPTPRTP
jgi:hypothetical protein